MNEREGRALLRSRFEKAGYRIQERWPYRASGASFEMDGFDPDARVGFEYLTTEAGDREEITPAVVDHLEERMRKGEIFVLLVDEREAPDRELLTFAADQFLKAISRLAPPGAKPKAKRKAKPKRAKPTPKKAKARPKKTKPKAGKKVKK